MSTSYTDVFTGKNITAAFPQYSAIALTENIELSWPAQFQNTNHVVAVLMDITPDAGGRTVKMPDATEGSDGFQFTINNPGGFNFNLIDQDNNLIVTIDTLKANLIWLIDNDTAAGIWRNIPAFGGAGAVSSINATSDNNNIVITGVPITSAGTIAFSLQRDLLALTGLGNDVGYAVRTAANTWLTRSILGTANQIVVTNPTAVPGNTSFALAPNLNGITSLTLAGLSFGVISASTIATTGANVDMTLAPNGTGEISFTKNAKLASGKKLKFIGDNATNYTTIRTGNTVINQDLIWPISAASAGQVMTNDGTGQLGWATVFSVPGVTTVNAVARYSNLTGSLKDSPNFITTDAGAVSGLLSAEIGAFRIATFDSQTIQTTGGRDFIVAPSENGAFNVRGDIQAHNSNGLQRQLRLFNLGDGAYAALQATPGMPVTATWNLPSADGAGYMMSNGAGQMSFLALTTVATNIPQFTNVTGTIGASPISISAGGILTGVTSLTIGNINLGTVANTIASTNANGNINLVPNGIGFVNLSNATASTSTGSGALVTAGGIGVALKAFIGGALNVTDTTDSTTTATGSGIFSGGLGIAKAITAGGNISLINSGSTLGVRLYNNAGTFYTGLQAGAAAANTTFTLPLAAPAATGIIKSSSAGVMSIDSLGASAGALRTDGSGNITVNNITTIATTIATYSDTVGTFAASASAPIYTNSSGAIGLTSAATLPANPCIVIPTNSYPGTPAGGAERMYFYAKTEVAGQAYACWAGSGAGGVSVSTTNTNTNKIKIRVNDVIYYLLASTSST